MWIEAILARDDFDRLLAQMTPLTIDIGSSGDHLVVHAPRAVEFVAGKGVRLQCEATVRWSVLGIPVPITIREVTVLFAPEVAPGALGHEVLVFGLEIEHADVAGIPALIDARIVERVNAVLREKRAVMAWDFAATLRQTVDLPPSLHPRETLALSAAWGKVRVTDEAVVVALSIHGEISRHDDAREARAADATDAGGDDGPARPTAPPAPRPRPRAAPPVTGADLVLAAGGGLALAAGGLYGGYRLAERDRRRETTSALVAGAATLAAAALVAKLGARVVGGIVRRITR